MTERIEEVRGYKFVRLKSGRLISFWQNISALDAAQAAFYRTFSRAFKLAADDWDYEIIELRMDRVDDHIAALRQHMVKLRGHQKAEERIALLRSTAGRTPEEAELYQRKADALEAKLGSVA